MRILKIVADFMDGLCLEQREAQHGGGGGGDDGANPHPNLGLKY